MGWLLYDTVGTNYYPITNEKLVRQISGLNYVTCKLEDVVLASNTLVNILDESGDIIFIGFIKKTADPTDDINRYEITERASEMEDYLTDVAGEHVFDFATLSVDTIINNVLSGSGWTKGSNDATTLSEVSFYYNTVLDMVFRVLVDYRDHFVWFNNSTKTVYFGSSRTDRTASDVSYISKNAEIDSNNRIYDKIIIIGANDSIKAEQGTGGGTIKCYQYPQVKTSYEALQVCIKLFNDMGTSNKGRVTCLLEPTSLYDEGDLVSIDGSNYIVYNIEMSAAGTKLVCDSRTTNIGDVFVEEKYKPKYDSVISGGTGGGDFYADGSVPMTGDLDMNANSLDDIWNANFYAISGGDGKIHWVYNTEIGNFFELREVTGNAYAEVDAGYFYGTAFRTHDTDGTVRNLYLAGDTIGGIDYIRSHYTGVMQIISDHLTNPDVIEFEFANGINMKVGNDMSFQDLYYIKGLKDPVANQDGATKKYVDDNSVTTHYIHVDDYGAVGNGTSDDSGAFTSALAALGTTGGIVMIDSDKKYLIDNNLTVPAGCSIKGQIAYPGTLGDNNSTPYGNYGSALIINSSTRIILMSSASISNLIIYRKGMTFPAPNSDSFAGTAIEISGDDCHVAHAMILGFAKAVNSNGKQRCRFEYVYGDNTTGITVADCWDIAYFDNCHFWPFATIETFKDGTGTGATAIASISGGAVTSISVTVGGASYPDTPLPLIRISGSSGSGATAVAVVSGGAMTSINITNGGTGYTTIPDVAITYEPIIERAGTGYDFSNVADWARITNCFAYGYLNDFHFDDVNSVTCIGCGADQTQPRGDRESAGFSIEGTASEIRLLGCQAGGLKYGVYVNVTSAHVPSFIENCSIWSCNNGVYSNDGDINVNGGTIRDCPASIQIIEDDAIINGVTIRGTDGYAFATNGVYITGSASHVIVDDCVFKNIESAAIVNHGGTPNLQIGKNVYEDVTYKPVHQTSDPDISIASASTMKLPDEGDFFLVTGTTTINTIQGGWYGRTVTLRFASSLTVVDGASPSLELNGNYTVTGGDTLTLVSKGYTEWYELARSDQHNVISYYIGVHAAIASAHHSSTSNALNITPSQVKCGDIRNPSSGALQFRTSAGDTHFYTGDDTNGVTFARHVRPYSDNAYVMGDASHRWSLVRGVTVTSGDLGFEETTCPKCGKSFNIGDTLILVVKSLHEYGTLTIPMHLKCVDLPPVKLSLPVPQMRDEWIMEGELLKTTRVPDTKIETKTVLKIKPEVVLVDGIQISHHPILDTKTGKFKLKGRTISKNQATQLVDETVEVPIYKDVEITI